ncbi:DNA repair protein [Babesia caballi]|uniref:DNA repair protein n=1 Tax=Babesia caballi TaxID=5871 RepID=A0AAV4LT33_BABCB|nr:DNA repair protein [Babesia caballi]
MKRLSYAARFLRPPGFFKRAEMREKPRRKTGPFENPVRRFVRLKEKERLLSQVPLERKVPVAKPVTTKLLQGVEGVPKVSSEVLERRLEFLLSQRAVDQQLSAKLRPGLTPYLAELYTWERQMRDLRRVYRAQYLQKLAAVTEAERHKQYQQYLNAAQENKDKAELKRRAIYARVKERAVMRDTLRIEKRVSQAIQLERLSKRKIGNVYFLHKLQRGFDPPSGQDASPVASERDVSVVDLAKHLGHPVEDASSIKRQIKSGRHFFRYRSGTRPQRRSQGHSKGVLRADAGGRAALRDANRALQEPVRTRGNRLQVFLRYLLPASQPTDAHRRRETALAGHEDRHAEREDRHRVQVAREVERQSVHPDSGPPRRGSCCVPGTLDMSRLHRPEGKKPAAATEFQLIYLIRAVFCIVGVCDGLGSAAPGAAHLRSLEVSPADMKLKVKTLNNQEAEVDVSDGSSVEDLMRAVEAALPGMPSDRQKLIHSGKVLKRELLIADYADIKDGDKVIVITPKQPEAPSSRQPASAASTSSSGVKTAAQPAAAPSLQPVAQPSTSSESQLPLDSAASRLVTGTELETNIARICEMGFSRPQVEQAMAAAFNNPERAVEFLSTGNIPSPSDLLGSAPAPVQQQPGVSPGNSLLDGVLNCPEPRQHVQRLRQMILADPERIQQLIDHIGQIDPELHRDILSRREEFIEDLRREADSYPAADDGSNFVQLTPEEMQSVERLEGLGFPRSAVIEAYMACDKNEELAANYLLENTHDLMSDE